MTHLEARNFLAQKTMSGGLALPTDIGGLIQITVTGPLGPEAFLLKKVS